MSEVQESAPGRLNPALQEGEWTARLLACLQKALGHELPNHLIAIQGLLQILGLEEAGHLGPEGRDYLERLTVASRRTHELIRALAEVVRSHRNPQAAEPILLAEVVEEAMLEVQRLFATVPTAYDFSGLDCVVLLPAPALRQVFLHLLRNAAQATAGVARPHITVQARVTGAEVEITVTDNGRGLSPQRLAVVCEPFTAADLSQGNGLGLFWVRQMVEGWGGTINFHSEEQRGTTVRMRGAWCVRRGA